MDMSVFEIAAEGVVLPIKHPVTGQPLKLDDGTAVTVIMVGMDSAEWRAREREVANKRLAGTAGTLTAEDIEEESLASIAAVIKGWTGIRIGEREYACTPENKLQMLARYPHFKRQIDAFLGNRENFLKVSQES